MIVMFIFANHFDVPSNKLCLAASISCWCCPSLATLKVHLKRSIFLQMTLL